MGSTRSRVLDALLAGPADLDSLAAQLDLHRTVIHGHLRRLVAARLVEVTVVRSSLGRPRHSYRLLPDAVEQSWPARQHRLLAVVLAGALAAHASDPFGAAKEAGVTYGRSLGIAKLEDLELLGWRYRGVEPEGLVCESCAFREACLKSDGLACHVHAGLLEVALAATVVPAGRSEGGCRFAVSGAGASPSNGG